MGRTLVLVYGVLVYAVFFGVFLYAIGFAGDFAVSKSLDTGPAGPVGTALAVDLGLLALFAIQHSVMARQGFKRWWTRLVPPPVERSTYVLLSSLIFVLLFWQWRPIPHVIWSVDAPVARGAIRAAFWAGWAILLLATFMIDHFDLFGLRQAWLHYRGRAYAPVPFRTTGLYRFVRHPILLGFLVAFWAAPRMTAGHLVFSLATTVYCLVGIRLEERDLATSLGDEYARYRARVPALVPSLRPYRS